MAYEKMERKERGMQEVRVTLECVYPRRITGWRIYLPTVQVRHKGKSRKRWAHRVRVELGMVLQALAMAVCSYHVLAYMAYSERGYHAYGGECLAAVVFGVCMYLILKEVGRHEKST